MIPKKIHQIFHNWGTDLKDVELFKKSIATLKEKNPDFTHKLWSKKDCLRLIETKYPQYLQFYKDLRHNIQRVDFCKICIVHSEGGFYIDLDMHCIKSFEPLLKEKLIIESNKHLVPNHNEFVQNDFLASEKGFVFWEAALKECILNYKDKEKVNVYNTWKGRFVGKDAQNIVPAIDHPARDRIGDIARFGNHLLNAFAGLLGDAAAVIGIAIEDERNGGLADAGEFGNRFLCHAA